ncbi:MAG TPA: hypothetical protein VLG36_05580 [Candidatus Chromulinivoraceae bacterium]|nr:hypothetical protein [Candidatus Chromulinivoraceae bacterium]
MNNDHQKRTQLARRIILIVVSAIAVIAIGLGVALLLKNIKNLNGNTSQNINNSQSTTQNAQTAASVVSSYMAPDAIRTLTSSYRAQQDTASTSNVDYQADGQSFAVNITTSHYALFTPTSKAGATDPQDILAQSTTFMQDHGYQKVDIAGATTGPTQPTVTTYTDLGATCQLTSAPMSTPPFYILACADKTDIDKEYATINKLLDLYKKVHQVDAFTKAISSTITSGNKSMTTIALINTHTHPVLLFASIDGNWEYVGNVGDGTNATSNGKYSLTPDVQAAITNPKYGDFLTHNLQ